MNSIPRDNLESNPIYNHLIDYNLIVTVWERIEAYNEPALQTCRLDIRSIYERIATRYFAAGLTVPPFGGTQLVVDWRQLSAEQLVVFSQEVFEDVCEFVICVMLFYRLISSSRLLTKEEKEQGNNLRELIKSMQQLIPNEKKKVSGTIDSEEKKESGFVDNEDR